MDKRIRLWYRLRRDLEEDQSREEWVHFQRFSARRTLDLKSRRVEVNQGLNLKWCLANLVMIGAWYKERKRTSVKRFWNAFCCNMLAKWSWYCRRCLIGRILQRTAGNGNETPLGRDTEMLVYTTDRCRMGGKKRFVWHNNSILDPPKVPRSL